MAENESLDIGNRNSTRWRKLRDLIRRGDPDEAIVAAIVENLYGAFKKVVKEKEVPLKALLEALMTGGDVRGIIRDCHNHEYAQLVAKQYQPGLSAFDIMEHTLWATADRFLDQIAFAVIDCPNWPDVQAFDQAQAAWRRDIFDDIRELAEKLAANPDRPPRRPSRTAEQKMQDLSRLNSMSLLPDRGEYHGQD